MSFGCGATAEEGENEVEDKLRDGERVGAVGALQDNVGEGRHTLHHGGEVDARVENTLIHSALEESENATDRVLATLGEIGRYGGIVVEFAIVVGVGQLEGGESIGDELKDAVKRVVGSRFELLSVSLFALRVELHEGQAAGLFVVEELIECSFRHIESLANGFHGAFDDAFLSKGFFGSFYNELSKLELLGGEVFRPRAGDGGYCGIAFMCGGLDFRREGLEVRD